LKTKDQWSDITQVLRSEKEVSSPENQNPLSFSNVCCSDTIHLAVSFNGKNYSTLKSYGKLKILKNFLEIFSIPTKLFDSKFKVSQVACGFEHIVILIETGCLYTCGSSR
jgi:hypothetical protein